MAGGLLSPHRQIVPKSAFSSGALIRRLYEPADFRAASNDSQLLQWACWSCRPNWTVTDPVHAEADGFQVWLGQLQTGSLCCTFGGTWLPNLPTQTVCSECSEPACRPADRLIIQTLSEPAATLNQSVRIFINVVLVHHYLHSSRSLFLLVPPQQKHPSLFLFLC